MDLRYTAEQTAYKERVRSFLEEHWAPVEDKRDLSAVARLRKQIRRAQLPKKFY